MAGLRIEIANDYKGLEGYHEYDYQGVKVYVDNNLIVKENAYIFMLPKLPFIKPFFDAHGIENKK